MYESKTFVYHGPGVVRCETRNIEGGPEDVIVKIRASARCGTDKTIFYKGHYKVNPPAVLGHEVSAEIVQIGPKVKDLKNGIGYREGEKISFDLKVGDRVTVQSRIARYENGLMLLSDPITILSFIIPGGYSQYMKIPKELILSGSVVKIPESVSDENAALAEPAACALESIFATPHPVGVDREGRHIYRSGIKKGGNACVIGSGTVSMIYALLCRLEEAKNIFIIVRSESKAETVRKIMGGGFKIIVVGDYGKKPMEEKLREEEKIVGRLKDETGGYLFDDVIPACPSSDAQRLMLKLYTLQGYAVGACFGGTHELVDGADIDQNHYRSAKTVGTSGCSTRAMETIVRWLGEGKISFKGFSNPKHFTFADKPEEFFTAEGLKPLLYPWE
ncbi:MAG: alcohol dehydrogenase catalytic domain-containing protein [Candidatus Omnitrophica bacterium]|nr:alcohol dehydrogenase catalytic domain-containing protein [Candidatus Omnitrophota bacterium]